MYCVNCGVKLQDGARRCPLCQTPVPVPAAGEAPANYPPLCPGEPRRSRYAAAGFLTVFLAAVCLSCMIFALRTYGELRWAGFVMLGIGAAYLAVFVPLWFPHPHPLVCIPLAYAALGGYLVFVCLRTGGHWYLSFAFPLVMLACLLTLAAVVLFRYVRGGRLFIAGGLLLATGGATMLAELFQHITFGSRMFAWSLYSVSAFGAFGLFLILAGIIRPLREVLERKFFL